MNSFAGTVLVLVWVSASSQERHDYLIDLKGDTLYRHILGFDKMLRRVVCVNNGKKIWYDAKDIRELKFDSAYYETGFVRLRQKSQYMFLRRIIQGKLSLYSIDRNKTKVLWKNFGEDVIRFRWIYRSQEWFKRIPVTVYFYRLSSEPRTGFSRSWRRKTRDCSAMQGKLKERNWRPTPGDIVVFYNKSCN